MSPHRPCVRCVAIRVARLVFIRVVFVPRGTAEWPARVDRVRWTLAIGDWWFCPSKLSFLQKATCRAGCWNFICLQTYGENILLQELSRNPNPQHFPKVLSYNWEAYCCTNRKRTAVEMGGVLLGFPFFKALKPGRYSDTKGGGYCGTNWRCTGSNCSTF